MQSGLPAVHFNQLASASEHIIFSIYWKGLVREKEERERIKEKKERGPLDALRKRTFRRTTSARRKKSSLRKEKKEEQRRTETIVYSEGRGHDRLQTLSCVVPSWGKVPGYDSFPWSVKRLREH